MYFFEHNLFSDTTTSLWVGVIDEIVESFSQLIKFVNSVILVFSEVKIVLHSKLIG